MAAIYLQIFQKILDCHSQDSVLSVTPALHNSGEERAREHRGPWQAVAGHLCTQYALKNAVFFSGSHTFKLNRYTVNNYLGTKPHGKAWQEQALFMFGREENLSSVIEYHFASLGIWGGQI